MLRINLADQDQKTTGQILNLLSNDANSLEHTFLFTAMFLTSPLVIIGSIYMLASNIGYEILAGIPISLLFLIVATILGNLNAKFK